MQLTAKYSLVFLLALTMVSSSGVSSAATTQTTTSTQSCAFSNWVQGKNYAAGSIVKYTDGLLYKAKYANPGYIPTVSTYFWAPFSCATTSTAPVSNLDNCNIFYTIWKEGAPYKTGDTVKFTDGNYYKAKYDNPGYIPTVSTYFWAPYVCSVAPATTNNTSTTTKVIGTYWTFWQTAPIRIRDINPYYNTIYLFHARPVGGSPGTTGAVYWTPPADGRGAASNFVADIQYVRKTQGRKVILSVGGAGNGMSFPYRAKSQAFVNSVVALYNQFGGFDGMDWNTFEADQAPDTAEMIWISLELKKLYPGFIITAPPAPWNQLDLTFCEAMVKAGAMDYAAPQYYDGPGLNAPSYVVSNVAQWVSKLGADHVVLGMGVWNQPNYMTIDDAASAWTQVAAKYPTVRGVFDWQNSTDETQGWSFANRFGKMFNP
ncbi:MAG: glycosyl hydrolase family 18 protein [Pseudomonadota bacterium]